MFCTKCGTGVLSSDQFCTKCGASITPKLVRTVSPGLWEKYGPLLRRIYGDGCGTQIARTRRYPLLTVWLLFLLLAYLALWFVGIVSSIQSIFGRRPWMILYHMPAMAGLTFTVGPVVCAWAIFQMLRWRRTAFFVYAGVTAALGVLNILLRFQIALSVAALISVGILHGLLQRGAPSAWQEMIKANSTGPAAEDHGS